MFQQHTSRESHHSHFWTSLYYPLPLWQIYQVIVIKACFYSNSPDCVILLSNKYTLRLKCNSTDCVTLLNIQEKFIDGVYILNLDRWSTAWQKIDTASKFEDIIKATMVIYRNCYFFVFLLFYWNLFVAMSECYDSSLFFWRRWFFTLEWAFEFLSRGSLYYDYDCQFSKIVLLSLQ